MAGEVEKFENICAEAKKFRAAAITWSSQCISNVPVDAARCRGHDKDAITHVDGFINVVSNEKHCSAAIFPEPQHFVLQAHAGEGVECAEWFVEEENFRVIDERACQSNALGHAPGKMMRISIGKCLESDEPHEFVHFISFFAQNSARNQAGLDIAPNRKPGKQIWILKNEATFRARLVDWVRANQKFARVGKFQTGNESQQGRLAAPAWANERNQFSRRYRQRDIT